MLDPDVDEGPARPRRSAGDMTVMHLVGEQVMHQAVIFPRKPRKGQLQVIAVGIRAERDTVALGPQE